MDQERWVDRNFRLQEASSLQRQLRIVKVETIAKGACRDGSFALSMAVILTTPFTVGLSELGTSANEDSPLVFSLGSIPPHPEPS